MSALPDPSPSPDDHETLALVESLFKEARKEKRRLLPKWNSYYRLVRNDAWSQFRDKSLPSPSSSEVYPTLHTLIAYCLDQFPEFQVSPALDIRDFQTLPPDDLVAEKSRDMEDLLRSWWITAGAHARMEPILWDAFTFGAGIIKTGLNQTAQDGLGEVFLSRVDPYDFLPDPNASSFEDASYCVEVSHIPLYELKRRFPDRADLVEEEEQSITPVADRRPKPPGGGLTVVSQTGSIDRTGEFPGTPGTRTGNRWAKAGDKPEDYTRVVRLIEVWVRGVEREEIEVDGETLYIDAPKWEYIAAAGGVVLTEDTSNPYDHGQLPYVRLPMVENGEFWSIPLTEHLRPNQIALNRLLAAMQQHAELCGNPILIEPEMAGTGNQKWHNRPGMRVATNIQATNLIRWLDPPNMSPTVMNLVGFHRDTIDRVSGISAVARGSQLRRREPAAAVDAVQEASFVRVRAVLRNYEESLRQAGDLTASNVVQFYNERRTIPIIGPSGSRASITLAPNHFMIPQADVVDPDKQLDDVPMKFRTWVTAGSSQPISRMARAAEADQLFEMDAIDRAELLRAHNYPNADKLAADMDAKEQQAAQQAALTEGAK